MGGGGTKTTTEYVYPSAAETSQANKETSSWNTAASFVDQYTPTGSYKYTMIDPGNGTTIPPRYRLDVDLSPDEKAKMDAMNQIQLQLLGLGQSQIGRVNDAVANPFDWDSMPAIQGRDEATENAMKYLTYGYDDRYSNAQKSLEAQLASQGIRPGTAAYTQAMNNFDSSKNQAYETAGLQAYMQGLTEQEQSAAMRQRAIEEQAYARNLPLNELNALISGTQVSMPTFTPISTSSANQMPYQASSTTTQSGGGGWGSDLLGLGGSLGSAAILGSFMSTKKAKTPIGEADSVLPKIETLPIENWKYRIGFGDGREHIGPYAEDWAERFGGTGVDISIIDAVGVCLKGIKELQAEIVELKNELAEARKENDNA